MKEKENKWWARKLLSRLREPGRAQFGVVRTRRAGCEATSMGSFRAGGSQARAETRSSEGECQVFRHRDCTQLEFGVAVPAQFLESHRSPRTMPERRRMDCGDGFLSATTTGNQSSAVIRSSALERWRCISIDLGKFLIVGPLCS
jgi:hypothetical protein